MWLVQILDGQGGGLGCLVIIITVIFTIGCSILGGIFIFSSEKLPHFILVIPGFIVGGIAFFIFSKLLWKYKKPK